MKTEITNVSLSFCCKEDWNSFKSIDERTKFCASCKHRVIDFTKASAEDLAKAQKRNERICGRFSRSQMSAVYLSSLAAATIASTILSCSDPVSLSQEQQPIAPEEILMGEPPPMVGIIALPIPPPLPHMQNFKIVRDTSSSDQEAVGVCTKGLDPYERLSVSTHVNDAIGE